MTVLFWPKDDHDCRFDPANPCWQFSHRIFHPNTVHLHCETDAAAGLAFHHYGRRLYRRWDEVGGSLLGEPANVRYLCVRGPSGLVRDVRFSEDEVNAAIRSAKEK